MPRTPWNELTRSEKLFSIEITNEVIQDVREERDLQNEKWGLQRHPDTTWLAILVEEVGEYAQAINSTSYAGKSTDANNRYEELVQVAAVAIAAAEQLREQQIMKEE